MKITIENNGEVYSTTMSGNSVSPEEAINKTLYLFQEIYTPYHVSYVLRKYLDPNLFSMPKHHFLH